ncbi:hypothetical protein AAC387_Pa07g0035 [Persea americana]
MRNFVWKNIITRFGIPRTLFSDNGTQFDSNFFRNFYQELGIRNVYSTPTYPQSNGQVEISNKVVLDGLKKSINFGLHDSCVGIILDLNNIGFGGRTGGRGRSRIQAGELGWILVHGVVFGDPCLFQCSHPSKLPHLLAYLEDLSLIRYRHLLCSFLESSISLGLELFLEFEFLLL